MVKGSHGGVKHKHYYSDDLKRILKVYELESFCRINRKIWECFSKDELPIVFDPIRRLARGD